MFLKLLFYVILLTQSIDCTSTTRIIVINKILCIHLAGSLYEDIEVRKWRRKETMMVEIHFSTYSSHYHCIPYSFFIS